MLLILFLAVCATAYDVRFITPPPKDRVPILWMIKELEPQFRDYPSNSVRVHVLGPQDADGHISGLLLYHVSNVSYSTLLSKITYTTVDPYVYNITTPYRAKNGEQSIGLAPLRAPVCPDSTVEFVAGTAYPEFPTALNYTVQNYLLASSMGYRSEILVGVAATRQNYLDYLSCPNLGGFNNIGHGDPNEIFVYDGSITSDDLQSYNLANLTTVVFNSCNVMNDPMSTVMNGNGARFFAGGISELMIGSSEPVTYCFWQNAFSGNNMTSSLSQCSQLDPSDQWGSEDPSGQEGFTP
jgi:hypothetical protein